MSTQDQIQNISEKKTRTSARDLLMRMPDVFSVAEFSLVTGRARTESSQYLWRFSLNGLVKGLGGKSGIFLNAVKNPGALVDGSVWERAVLKAMPSAMIGGHEVLAESGLSTQVTHQRYVLISNTDAMYEIEGAEVHRRPVPWLKKLLATNAVVNDAPGVVIPKLMPGAALADLALYGQSCPDPDDLDFDFVDPAHVAMFRRLAAGSELEVKLFKPQTPVSKRRSLKP